MSMTPSQDPILTVRSILVGFLLCGAAGTAHASGAPTHRPLEDFRTRPPKLAELEKSWRDDAPPAERARIAEEICKAINESTQGKDCELRPCTAADGPSLLESCFICSCCGSRFVYDVSKSERSGRHLEACPSALSEEHGIWFDRMLQAQAEIPASAVSPQRPASPPPTKNWPSPPRKSPSPSAPTKEHGNRFQQAVQTLAESVARINEVAKAQAAQAAADAKMSKELNAPRPSGPRVRTPDGAFDLRDPSRVRSEQPAPAPTRQLAEEALGAIEKAAAAGDFGGAMRAKAQLDAHLVELDKQIVRDSQSLPPAAGILADAVPKSGDQPFFRPMDRTSSAGGQRPVDLATAARHAIDAAAWKSGVGDGRLHDLGGVSPRAAADHWKQHGTLPPKPRRPAAFHDAYGSRVFSAVATEVVVTEDRTMYFIGTDYVFLNGSTNRWEAYREVAAWDRIPEHLQSAPDSKLLREGVRMGWWDAVASGTAGSPVGIGIDGFRWHADDLFSTGVSADDARGGGGWLNHPVSDRMHFPHELVEAGYETAVSPRGLSRPGGPRVYIGGRHIPASVWNLDRNNGGRSRAQP